MCSLPHMPSHLVSLETCRGKYKWRNCGTAGDLCEVLIVSRQRSRGMEYRLCVSEASFLIAALTNWNFEEANK